MKKLMIMAFAVACTAIAQAASVTWGSGALYTAADKNGGWSTTTAMSAGALVTMNVYLVDATVFGEVAAKDMAGIYEWASTQTAKYTGMNKNPSTQAIIGAASITTQDLAASTTYYSIITAEYTDANYGDMYMATTKSFTTPASGVTNNANLFGGTAGVKDWAAAVPEPTSGLLLLLGMAGLALKRKVA